MMTAREVLDGVIRIDLGCGSLVSDNISLTPEQADIAMEELMNHLQVSLRAGIRPAIVGGNTA
jgi:hypothetical protein